MERQTSPPEYNVFLQEHPPDPPDQTPTRRDASTDEPRTNTTDNSQTARPQRRSQPVTFFDGTTWGGATADPVVPSSNASTCPIQSDRPTNATPSNTNRVTRLRARQKRSPEPSHTRWEEVTWLIASLRDTIMRQEVKMEEIRTNQVALEKQNETLRVQNAILGTKVEELISQNNAQNDQNATLREEITALRNLQRRLLVRPKHQTSKSSRESPSTSPG